MKLVHQAELEIPTLGPCRFDSPLRDKSERCIDESRRVLVYSDTTTLERIREAQEPQPSFEPAGPREQIFFEPERLTCGIVTCGGLCPGLNDVIRSLVLTLNYAYGVRSVLGFRFGLAGVSSRRQAEPIFLTPPKVESIHEDGGTILGSSRGSQDAGDMVDELVRHDVGILFAIGGDGTMRAASALREEVARRGMKIGIVGIPKTIDNDLQWTARSFGFDTAVSQARDSIRAAHVEAKGAWNGIGLVKLMGRHSGFIAAVATLADNDVNFCLVPEVPLVLEGPSGFLEVLEERLGNKHHAVIVVAEGAGQDLMEDSGGDACDASGNVRLKDIGVFLQDRIVNHFATRGIEATLKYIDPSYMIRSLPANSTDSAFCLMLGQHAVHAGMAGRTDVVVGYWNQRFVHVPIALATASRRQVDPNGELWPRVLEATGQPA